MKKIIQITLSGHPASFQLDVDADAALQSYLDRARLRLENDPDQEEVLRDLEQSIGEKLAQIPGAASRVISRDEVDSVLEQVGAVDTGNAETVAPDADARPDHRRRLCRIQEGQWFAGVCQGLAAYSSIRIEWVRSIFIILSVFTSGLPIVIYVVMMFILPVVRTRDEFFAGYYGRPNAT